MVLNGNFKTPGVYDTQVLGSTNYLDILGYILDIRVASSLLNNSIFKLETKSSHEIAPILSI